MAYKTQGITFIDSNGNVANNSVFSRMTINGENLYGSGDIKVPVMSFNTVGCIYFDFTSNTTSSTFEANDYSAGSDLRTSRYYSSGQTPLWYYSRNPYDDSLSGSWRELVWGYYAATGTKHTSMWIRYA